MRTFLCLGLFLSFVSTAAQDRQRLPNPINTPSSVEYAPSITADGQTLIYQSDQYGVFVNGAKKVPQIDADGKSNVMLDEYEASFFGIYQVKLHPSGQWMKPEPIEAINQYANEFMTPVMGGPSVSYDGNTLFFFANFGKNGYGREDIYLSERTQFGWSKPKNIGNTINTEGYEGFPSISPDGRKLYFTREILGRKVEGKQCYKIMVSEKSRTGQWRAPYELPVPVNGSCEKAPRILADGKTLVFSSIRKEGKGDFDLYKTEQQPDGKWAEPQPLEFINTKKSDLFVSVSPCGDQMYYVSNGDIYTTSIPESLRPTRMATIQGFVLDSVSRKAISTRIVVKKQSDGTTWSVLENNPADGRFTALVPFGDGYDLVINQPEYQGFIKNFTLNSSQPCQPLTGNLLIQPISKDPTPVLAAVSTPKVSPSVQPFDPPVRQEIRKPLEEMELVAESAKQESVRMEAQGEKATGQQLIQNYALILRIVDKETGEFIANPSLQLRNSTGEQRVENALRNEQDYIFTLPPSIPLELVAVAPGYLPFQAKIPPLDSDKRITVRMAPRLKSYLVVSVIDEGENPVQQGNLTIQLTGETKNTVPLVNSTYQTELVKSGAIQVLAESEGYAPLTKELEIDLPAEGGKTYELKMQLFRKEKILTLSAVNIETGEPIVGAVFYVNDAAGKRLHELLSDEKGLATAKILGDGPLQVVCLDPNFHTTEQTIQQILPTTQVLFKAVKKKSLEREIKITFRDRLTQEELFPAVQVNNQDRGKAPIFLKGTEEQEFTLTVSGENIVPEKYRFAFTDSLKNRVGLQLLASQIGYDFYFVVYDQSTKRPLVRPTFKVVDLSTRSEVQQLVQGEFLARFNPNKQYALQVSAAGYQDYSQRVEAMDWITQGNFERSIFLIPQKNAPVASSDAASAIIIQTQAFGEITRGKKITLENIYFDQSSPVLREESYQQLNQLTQLLKENNSLKIEIRGHTDNVGDFYENVKLSKERCESVVKYLAGQGISMSRMTAVGKGPIEPIAPNTTEENKKKNRRVEFVVL